VATEKQLLSNRHNALRSTGPRTSEGKQAVSQNARKHGVLSQQALLPHEDPAALSELTDSVLDHFKPDGHWERILVDRIVQALWRLRRLGRAEAGLFTYARNKIVIQGGREEASRCRDLLDDDDDVLINLIKKKTAYHNAMKRVREAESLSEGELPMLGRAFVEAESTFSTLSRYEATIERGLYKALHELERRQAARSGVSVPPPVTGDIDLTVRVADESQEDATNEIAKQTQSPEERLVATQPRDSDAV
jgi:hypothetical protein